MFVGDSEMIKAAFVDFLLGEPSDVDLRNVLTQCLAHSPVAVCHGERTHYVVCLEALCDPVVLENWQAVEELIKTTSSGVSWITIHLPSEMLKVANATIYTFAQFFTVNSASFSQKCRKLKQITTMRLFRPYK